MHTVRAFGFCCVSVPVNITQMRQGHNNADEATLVIMFEHPNIVRHNLIL